MCQLFTVVGLTNFSWSRPHPPTHPPVLLTLLTPSNLLVWVTFPQLMLIRHHAQAYKRKIGTSKKRLYRTLTVRKWFWGDEHPVLEKTLYRAWEIIFACKDRLGTIFCSLRTQTYFRSSLVFTGKERSDDRSSTSAFPGYKKSATLTGNNLCDPSLLPNFIP